MTGLSAADVSADDELRRAIGEGVCRWHDHAVANGEERILARTVDGALFSYRTDEITLYKQGFTLAVAPV